MFEFLDRPIINLADGSFVTWGQIILAAFLTLFAWAFCRFIAKKLVGKVLNRTGINKDSAALIQKVIFFILLLIVAIFIMSLLKIPVTAFAFISGGVAIGLGFGAKTIIENFLSGWILMSERPIRLGDVVEIDGNFGTVLEIGNRSTLVKRNDGAHMAISNNQILESRIINLSIKDPDIRTFVRVGVAYGSDVNLFKELLTKVANDNETVRNEPAPKVIFEDFGDNALVFDLFIWVSIQSGRELREVRSDVRFEVSRVLNEHGIVVAFPQRDVHLHMDNAKPNDLFKDE